MKTQTSQEEQAASLTPGSADTAQPAPLWRNIAHRLARSAQTVRRSALALWDAPALLRLRRLMLDARRAPWSGVAVIVAGIVFTTLFILALDQIAYLPNHGIIYLPVVAFIAYYWDWRHGAVAAVLDLFCIYFFFAPPSAGFKPLTTTGAAQILTDAAVIAFVLAIVQLAASRRAMAEHEATRFASLASVGLALAGELHEEPLLRLIARTACDLTGAGFAAFTLRPVDAMGRPLAPSRGEMFHLAAVVGVTPEEEALFRHMPLGGEGLLAPIFRYGKTVRVADAAATLRPFHSSADGAAGGATSRAGRREAARSLARAYSRGAAGVADLPGVGVPRGHPIVRSFLGAPLLDRMGDVRGGLLLGHIEPDRFTAEDERLLLGLAAQAATSLENARLYRAAQSQAQELDVIFESIADGVALVDARGQTIRENGAAKALRDSLAHDGVAALPDLAQVEARDSAHSVLTVSGASREYVVSVTPVSGVVTAGHRVGHDGVSSHANRRAAKSDDSTDEGPAAVVVWHDVTEAQQLIVERRARAEADARRALLQVVIDELPSGVYLVYGPEARLVLANRAAFGLWGAEWTVGQPMVEFLREHGTQALRPDGQPMPLEELATLRAARSGEAVRHHQEIIARLDGVHLPILFNAVTVTSDLLHDLEPESSQPGHGEGHVVLVVLQDMTRLKEAEQLKDEFIAMAAHELRTPMAAVKGYAEMLQRNSGGDQGTPLDDWQREALDSIDLATTRLVDLTNDLLDVSRLQANRLELRREPHDLVRLIKRVVRRFQVTTQKHHIITQAPQEYVVATIDAPRMEQVVGNLLSNAIKYTPDGGDIVVEIAADEQAGAARVTVRDSGIGIPAEQQKQLFARFARAENAREMGIGGTGLGLYLCRELLAQMDGHIWFESQEGDGTTVYFEVPLHSADEDAGTV